MSIGIWQVVLILLIVLIIFGAGKLPKVMGDVAKGVKNFKSGLKEDDETVADQATARRIDETADKGDDASKAASMQPEKDEARRT